jgi:L-seryl-tRNA(Ser) seleniumtransferase
VSAPTDAFPALGVKYVINAQGRYTELGGSVLHPDVIRAMAEAARHHVDLYELQRRAGERIAELTNNTAAHVCSCASAGLFLSTLACVTGPDPVIINRLPGLAAEKEVIIHRAHRMPLDTAIALTGVRLVEIGNVMRTEVAELEAAITARTAAVVYVAGDFFMRGALTLDQTVEIAHRSNIPVIVDAAAQLPPVENLWRFTREYGADLAVFSGSKDLCGPQASGLVVGRAELIEACFLNGSPHTRLGRPMKVGKEEIVGLVGAVEHYMAQDHDARLAGFEQVVKQWIRELDGFCGLSVSRSFPNTQGQPVPRALIEIASDITRIDADTLRRRLLEGEPPVAVRVRPNDTRVFLSPDSVTVEEADVVTKRIRAVLEEVSASK